MSTEFRILVVDDEPEIVRDLVDLLDDEGHAAIGLTSSREALERVTQEPFDLLISDLRMPEIDGLSLLEAAKRARPELPVVVLTAHADPTLARNAIEAGAHDYVTKPWNTFELLLRVRRLRERWDLLAERRRLERYVAHLVGESGADVSLDAMVGKGRAMAEVFRLARLVARSDATALLRGESGTGKSALAAAIHRSSARAQGPFVKVNCGAIPEGLLESELFGHERGAFTGAVRQKPGVFEVAEHGTLFLDEIGDVPLSVQVKLLHAIEEKTFQRLGGVEVIRADVRLIAATHRDLEALVREERFREDLYYRLNVFPITIPPLRTRPEDVPPLVEHFLSMRGVESTTVRPEIHKLLLGQSFPGNVRELENLLERALILAGDAPLGPEHFPSVASAQHDVKPVLPEIPDGGISLEEQERLYILAALEKASGNKSLAARLLGMTRRTLYSRLERHGIPV